MKFLILLISFFTFAAHANENNCKSIQDSDKKNYCLATETKQRSFCYTIADSDLKNMCMAQLKQQKNYCYKIFSDEVQKECLKSLKWILILKSTCSKWNNLCVLLQLLIERTDEFIQCFAHSSWCSLSEFQVIKMLAIRMQVKSMPISLAIEDTSLMTTDVLVAIDNTQWLVAQVLDSLPIDLHWFTEFSVFKNPCFL